MFPAGDIGRRTNQNKFNEEIKADIDVPKTRTRHKAFTKYKERLSVISNLMLLTLIL